MGLIFSEKKIFMVFHLKSIEVNDSRRHGYFRHQEHGWQDLCRGIQDINL